MKGERLRIAVAIGIAVAGAGCTSSTTTVDAAPDAIVVDGDAGVDDGGPVVPQTCWEVTAGMETEVRADMPSARIGTADVFFLMDVTASMQDEIDVLRDALTSSVIPGIRAAAPDVWLSAGSFADFPVEPFGDASDSVLVIQQTSTSDDAAVEAGIEAYRLSNGRDEAESLVEALYLSMTGEGLGDFVAPADCMAGRVGQPCFRPESVPVFVVFTDAPSHEGFGGTMAYMGVTPAPHTFEDAAAALVAAGARFVAMDSGDGGARADLEALASATGTLRRDGTPLVFDVGRRGESIDPAVVTAITDLVSDVPMRVALSLEDVDGDAAAWFGAPRVVGVDPPEARIGDVGDAVEILPGAALSFALPLSVPSDFSGSLPRVRLSLREQAGAEVAAMLVELRLVSTGCP